MARAGPQFPSARAAARETDLVGETVAVVPKDDAVVRRKAEAKRLRGLVAKIVRDFVEVGLNGEE